MAGTRFTGRRWRWCRRGAARAAAWRRWPTTASCPCAGWASTPAARTKFACTWRTSGELELCHVAGLLPQPFRSTPGSPDPNTSYAVNTNFHSTSKFDGPMKSPSLLHAKGILYFFSTTSCQLLVTLKYSSNFHRSASIPPCRHPVLGDELYGFKDWNDRYSKVPQGVKPSEDAVSTNGSHRARVVRPLLHAAELVLPLPPWSISTLGRYEGSNDGGSQQQQHSATVEECPADYGSASGSKQLRLRCGMPSDFASVARTITGEDMNFNELLGPLPSSDGEEASTAALPSSSATSPSAIKYQASSPQQQKEGPSKVTKEHRAALLAAAEASEDGWYE